jgi:hypothetical protein
MAPEEWHHGSTIDWRTTVFGLGRAIDHLLRSDDGDWRGPAGTLEIVEKATRGEPAGRHESVDALNEAWLAMTAFPS